MGEWFIPEVLKTSAPVMGPLVRIQPPPLNIQILEKFVIFIKVLLCVCLFKDSYRNNKKFKNDYLITFFESCFL